MRLNKLAGLLAAASFSLVACAGGPNQSESTTLNLEAAEFSFTPTTLALTAGEPAKLILQNKGALEHDFSLMEFPLEGEAVASGSSGHEAGHGEGEEPDLHVSALGGQSASLEFTPSQAGTYEFWCTVEGHKEAGMSGSLVVQAP